MISNVTANVSCGQITNMTSQAAADTSRSQSIREVPRSAMVSPLNDEAQPRTSRVAGWPSAAGLVRLAVHSS